MPLIVGLGNIGKEYNGTRHNVGFELIDLLAESMSVTLSKGNGPYFYGIGRFKGQQVVLLKPTTLMNRSGRAVRHALTYFNESLDQTLVCYDDLHLEVGQIRLRPGGSAAGHNGVQNIIDLVGTKKFPRLRLGIGSDFARGQQVDYVLSPFSPNQCKDIDEALEEAQDAIYCFLRAGINQAMNDYNG
ncbi:MAG: aminoacyl-tRNA hydrolase [Bacteroidota bacterium]